MNKTVIHTSSKTIPADVLTPVGIYLRLRDRFRDTLLLESTDHRDPQKSFSFICIHAIAGIEVPNETTIECKMPGCEPQTKQVGDDLLQQLSAFMGRFDCRSTGSHISFAQALYGYTAWDAAPLFEPCLRKGSPPAPDIPLLRYRLYQYIIAIDHFHDELYLLENHIAGLRSDASLVEALVLHTDLPSYPFCVKSEETANMNDRDFLRLVEKGIAHCRRGDTFQLVLSRRFQRKFNGDEFNVYRALRNINPSPYLFYFDYGDYRLMGSSPEAQVVIRDTKATLHPIAGTYRRSGDEQTDRELGEQLLLDKKENAEHIMLVDLARNDLGRVAQDIRVSSFRKIIYFSHVMHITSEVEGRLEKNTAPFSVLAATFPAGTLSGAPKIRAMQLIGMYEPSPRCFYGGAVGFMGFDGSGNHAIIIRSFLSKNNTLTYQAGAGIVAASNPQSELDEINNKVGALRQAITRASHNSDKS